MAETIIKVQNLTKTYRIYDKPIDRLKETFSPVKKTYSRDFNALENVSFDVFRGENVGIIGTNGAGKSTLLKIITGVLNPTSGYIEVKGKISALLELGAGFNPDYTGIENVYLNGTMMGFTREEMEERIEGIVEFADIGEFIYQPVKSYSSGMFARLAFAVAINVNPEILIVDEALSVGDVFFQAKCYKKFDELKSKGCTILFVSHSLGTIMKYCDRVIFLDKGNKIAEGSSKDMINLYKKYLVNQGAIDPDEDVVQDNNDALTNIASWKEQMGLNPNKSVYGNMKGEIVDFAILDGRNMISTSLAKGTDFSVKIRAKFYDKIEDPIFAFTILNLQGVEVSGTNTMYEDSGVLVVQKGDEVCVTFTQQMNLQGGEYLLSLGLTGYQNGDFTVYHRLYEICNITVVSEKNTVGFF